MTSVTERKSVQALVEEVLDGSSEYVVDCSVGPRAVDVYVDSDGALAVDRLADISREVAFLLDAGGAVGGPFRINVSTPGLDRPLRLPRQYRKNVGRTLRVHFRKADGSGFAEVAARLEGADEEGIVVQGRRIEFPAILWAKVQLPW